MEFRLLGPLDVVEAGRTLALGGNKPRALLLVLLLARGEVVSRERLIEELWAGDAPRGAEITLRSHISRLRAVLGAERLLQRAPGYLLAVAPDDLDATRFERLAGEGRAALADGSPAEAAELLREALGLWRGPVASDVVDLLPVQGEAARLQELRMEALEERIDAGLQLRREHELIGELKLLVGDHPLREGLWAQLMLALYRCGRQAEALAAYAEARMVLIDRLGLEPGSRLRDLQRAILRQELPVDVPPSRLPRTGRPAALTGLRSVPVALTSLVGRSEQLQEVLGALRDHRLVTLTGIGGVGKTRLAQAVADAHSGGVAWVDLAPLSEETLIGATVARVLGLTEAPHGDAAAIVAQALGDADLVLVVDNCEHLIDEVARLLETWLGSCAGLRVLATSREPLRVPGELVSAVPPLQVTAGGDGLPDAARLFAERARMASATLELTNETTREIAAICRHLEGIPLAIELAAARVPSLGVPQIVDALDQVLGILTAGSRTAPTRHRTLERSIAWSHAPLDDRERALFRRVAVFAGEFSPASAIAVCAGAPIEPDQMLELLAALVEKSLLQPTLRDGRARYRLLDVVRQFARSQLANADETHDVHSRHATWQAAEAERREPLLFGDRIIEVLEELESDLDDIRAAAAWATARGDHDLALRLLAAPLVLWICRHPAEGSQRISAILAMDAQAEPRVLARAHIAASRLAYYTFENRASKAHAEVALAIGDAIAEPVVQAQARTWLGWDALLLAPATAEPILVAAATESRAVDDQFHFGHAIAGLGVFAAHHGRTAQAVARLEESLLTGRRAGDQVGIRRSLAFSGVLFAVRGEFPEAETRFSECEQITRALGDRHFLSLALDYTGFIALHRGDVGTARARIEESLDVAQKSTPIALCRSHTMMAMLSLAIGEFDLAVVHADEALLVVAERDLNWHVSMLFGVASEAYRRAGRPDVADRLRRDGLAKAQAVCLVWAEAACQAASDRVEHLLHAVSGFARLGHTPELLRTLDVPALSLHATAPTAADTPRTAWLIDAVTAARQRLGLVPFPADREALESAARRLQTPPGTGRRSRDTGHGAGPTLAAIVDHVLLMRPPEARLSRSGTGA